MGIARCPYDPNDNSTAVWVEQGNPGNLPGLYSGTNAEFTKADTVIFRADLHNLTTGRKEYSFKRTIKYDSIWLDSKYQIIIIIIMLYYIVCSQKIALLVGFACVHPWSCATNPHGNQNSCLTQRSI